MEAKLWDLDAELTPSARLAIELLASGGDDRIVLDSETALNRYMSAPYPRRALAFASSTANDIRPEAFRHVTRIVEQGIGDYSQRLTMLSDRIHRAYGLGDECRIVFAPSGTDLEYVALAAVLNRAPGGIHNVLLGADEVGRGCLHSANGRYFASKTATGFAARVGAGVEGLENVSLVDIPVRSIDGRANSSNEVAQAIRGEIERARSMGKHALIHVVHGSKTGLILPRTSDLDRLEAKFGDAFSVVVDACQARISSAAVRDYIARGAMVFLTGSKFMGGPPFSGFALVPSAMIGAAGPLPSGLATIFRRAEWPDEWPGTDSLPDTPNEGLALRLEASIFEFERFQAIPRDAVERVILLFQQALAEVLLVPFGFRLVPPYPGGAQDEALQHPREMLTLATLDISVLACGETFSKAEELHRTLAMSGVRLGQPVKSVRTSSGEWAGTLRVGLSMGQIHDYAKLPEGEQYAALAADLGQVAAAIERAVANYAADHAAGRQSLPSTPSRAVRRQG